MIARRSFLAGILGAAVAPAIVRASSLMPVAPKIIVPPSGLYTGEIGVIEDVRFVTSPLMQLRFVQDRVGRISGIGVRHIDPGLIYRDSPDPVSSRFQIIKPDLAHELRRAIDNIKQSIRT